MSVKKLKEFSKSVNIASELSDEQLREISLRVTEGFIEDQNSMAEWIADVKRIEELSSLKSVKKSVPLPNSANVKLPIITKACFEYAARAVPEIIKDDQVVKGKVIGKARKAEMRDIIQMRADRSSEFMNYELLLASSEWACQLNDLLLRLALIGFLCKKTWYDPIRKKVKSIICKPEELIINCDAPCLEEASRVSHILHWRMNDLVEGMNKKENDVSVFLEKPVKELMERYKGDTLNSQIDGIEQCTYLDLDGDGLSEPYIVTQIQETGEIIRIVAQYSSQDIYSEGNDVVCYINKEEYYEDFHFLPNPKGGFLSVGFGILLLHLNESINSVMNQLLDSGQLANMKGGYMDARLKNLSGGNSRHDPGQFILTKVMSGTSLKEGIVPLDFGEPSSVLYQLLSLLIDVSRDLTASAQINNGTQSSENAKTGATLALQEEGRKIHNVINKSVYRSLNKEFKHRFKLYSKHLDQKHYENVLNDELASVQKDFDITSIDVIPLADPNLASSQQKVQEAGLIQQLLQSIPGLNVTEGKKMILERIGISGIMKLLEPDQNAPQIPPPEILKLQAEMEESAQKLNIEGARLDLEKQRLSLEAAQAQADIALKKAQGIALLAKAESEDAKIGLEQYKAQLDALNANLEANVRMAEMSHEKQMQNQQQPTDPEMINTEIEATPDENASSEGMA